MEHEMYMVSHMFGGVTLKANHDFNVTIASLLMMIVHVLFDLFTCVLI